MPHTYTYVCRKRLARICSHKHVTGPHIESRWLPQATSEPRLAICTIVPGTVMWYPQCAACKWSNCALCCRPNSPQVSSVDSPASMAPMADINLPMDPGHVSKDGLPLVDADTFAKLLSEVSMHRLPFSQDLPGFLAIRGAACAACSTLLDGLC